MSDIKYTEEEQICVDFGKNNFIEVARKIATVGEKEHEFISLGRGYYKNDGSKKYVKSLSLPIEKEKRREIARAIMNIL